jgi:outer membrane protein assembly factor BamB
MRVVRAGIGVVAVAVVLSSSLAAAAEEPRPVRYRDGTILTLDPSSGRTRWVAEPKRGEYLDLSTVGRSLVIGISGPCGGDGLEQLHAVGLDLETGEPRWRARVAGSVVPPGTGQGRVILVGSDGGIIGLDAGTGRRKWRIPTSDVIGATGTHVFVDEGRGSNAEQLVAHDRRTGKERWTFRFPRDVSGATVVVATDPEDVVVARGGFNTRYGTPGGVDLPGSSTTLFTLDARTGRERHRMVVADPRLEFSGAVLHDGVLALIDGTEVTGIDLAAGRAVWRRPLTHPLSSGLVRVSGARNGRVTIVSERADHTVAALDTVTGKELWLRPDLAMVGTGSARSVVLLAPLQTYTSEPVQGVDAATGETRWTRTLRSTYAVPEPQLLRPGFAPMAVSCGTP